MSEQPGVRLRLASVIQHDMKTVSDELHLAFENAANLHLISIAKDDPVVKVSNSCFHVQK